MDIYIYIIMVGKLFPITLLKDGHSEDNVSSSLLLKCEYRKPVMTETGNGSTPKSLTMVASILAIFSKPFRGIGY